MRDCFVSMALAILLFSVCALSAVPMENGGEQPAVTPVKKVQPVVKHHGSASSHQIPEPPFALLGGLGLLIMLRRRRN